MGLELKIHDYFSDIETVKDHNGYFCSVGEALTVVIIGTLCLFRSIQTINPALSDQ
jgi:hypothetical protein